MRTLARDQRGAIMVMALFMAIFATGCLHYLVGIAQAIAHRERMQDAADAAAFSAAVLHARGMNVIALINMTMAALLAILIALKLIQLVSIVGVGLATGLSVFTGGGSLVAVAPFTQVGVLATQGYEQAQPVVHGTLRALRIAARGVRIAIPWVAQASTVKNVVAHYSPPAAFGFEVPGTLTLPTRDGTYDDLCKKAGEYVSDLIDYGVSAVPMFGFSIGDVTSGLTDKGSTWFCGTEDTPAPAIKKTLEVWQPLLPKTKECQSFAEGDNPSEVEHTALCAEAKRENEESKAAIAPGTGACIGADCSADGLYELRARLALEACAPRSVADYAVLGQFTWQARRFMRRYVWSGEAWEVEADVVPGTERYTLESRVARPCGTASSTVGPEWNTEQQRDGEHVPICSSRVEPPSVPLVGQEVLVLAQVEVTRIFGCRERVRERRVLDTERGALQASGDDGNMAPQLIAEGAVLGQEPFQIRAFVAGSLPSASPEAMLGNLTSTEAKHNALRTLPWALAARLGRISVAQAEFYFDSASAKPADYLWAMSWTARLRRFRLPLKQPGARETDDQADAIANGVEGMLGSFEAACAAVVVGGFSCDDLDPSSFADRLMH